MSGRSTRKKKAPTKLQDVEDEDAPRTGRSGKSVQKPKYVTDSEQQSARSSRQSSPETPTPVKVPAKRGRKPGSTLKKKIPTSGTETPVNRNSRASSVSSTAKVAKKSVKKVKLKTKLGRGYNPNLVNYKDSEYHYGSDFEDNDFNADNVSEKSSDSEISDFESVSDDMKPESDVELEPNLLEEDLFTPDPFWLQESAEIPVLVLPESSDDLVLRPAESMMAVAVYEVLRQFFKIIRLSPFRLEDFCQVLKLEEQSNLLSEIHICLLKALLREDDNAQAQYGPLDQKDSMNVFLYFIDSITWPENLKFYLSSDAQVNKEVLDVLAECEYPFTSVENRLKILKELTDTLLSTAAVRDDLLNEGSMPLEDHCRVCHRLGDMVVCEHCNGPFHGTCLHPPLYEVPDEDWICPVCMAHMVEGVSDCLSTEPGSCRIQSLGTDRHGSRYWFASRRLWVQGREDKEAWYYSTRAQLNEVLEVLDENLYEKDLYNAIIAQREEFEAQMDLTEKLASENTSGSKKSLLEMDNMILDKLQKERNDLLEYQEAQRRQVQEDIDRQIREEDEERGKAERERVRKEREEKRKRIRKEREERMKKREENRGDGLPEEIMEDDPDIEDGDLEPMEEEEVEESNQQQIAKTQQKLSYSGPLHLKRGTLPPGSYFRLGEEGTYKSYVNQYSVHHHALSRIQSKEESEKRSRLSHKFSLTDVSSFKWSGSTQGTRTQLAGTIRQTILQLETNIPLAFMHTNWSLLRKPWIQAVTNCTNPSKDFSRALTVLTCCIKSCILLPVWTDSLGHTMVKKIGYQGKEEKKKMEKREKKEREDEEERLRPFMTWVKYTLPVRSLSVVRQKGEEYRAHGRNGWLWISATRNYNPKSCAGLGMRGGPHRIAVKYTELKTSHSKVVLMEPVAFNFLIEVQKERDDRALARAVAGEPEPNPQDVHEVIDVEKTEEEKRKENLTKILDMSRLDMQDAKEEDLGGVDGVVDVTGGIANPTRLLYPKTSKKSKLDDLLGRRIQLKNLEEKRFQLNGSKVDTEVKDTKTTVTSDILATEGQHQSLEAWLTEARDKLTAALTGLLSLDLAGGQCYSPLCQLENTAGCYSSACRAGQATGRLLDTAQVYAAFARESAARELKDFKVMEDLKFADVDSALAAVREGLALIKVKEEEVNDPNAIQTISSAKTEIKEENESLLKSEIEGKPLEMKSSFELQSLKTEAGTEDEANMKRIYSNPHTSHSLYLKRIQTLAEAKRPSRIVKYPLAPTFWSTSHAARNILIMSKHDARKLARSGGLIAGEGYNYASKANSAFWPYPCPRPSFRTVWLYRTAGMSSLHSVAMQLRILWMCLRWDDMNTKSPNPEGKNQVTTENEIVTTEILKHRNRGRFLEHTQYFQRRVTIPLDQPRKQVDYSPIRSGLRKRKRVESPVQAEPQVEEKWIDEGDLELWEIRTYRDKIDRERNAAVTRRQVGTNIKAPEKYDPSEETKKRSTVNSDMKAKIDAHIKEQREAFKASRSTTPDLPNSKPSLAGVGAKKIGENNIKIVSGISGQSTYTTAKKIFISRDGKIIGHQVSNATPTAPAGKIAIAPVLKPFVSSATGGGGAATSNASPSAQQKVQIVKTADGKIQVRGLLPGQQLVQMPDGKLQIFSNAAGSPGIKLGGTAAPSGQPAILPKPATPVIQHAKTYTIQRPAGSTVPTVGAGAVTPIQPKPSITGITPNPNITLATPTQRFQLIHPNSQPSMVHNPSTATSTVNHINNLATPQMLNSVVNNTPGVIQSTKSATVAASPVKTNTLVGIQSLGQNTVTIKDGQLIVQGPDHEAATAIARQLASGQAKLANLGGKQVLLITNPNQLKTDAQPQQLPSSTTREIQQQQQQSIVQDHLFAGQQQQQQQASPYQMTSPQQVSNQQYPQLAQQQQLTQHEQLSQQQQLISPQAKSNLLEQQLTSPSQPAQPVQSGSITVTAQLVQTPQGPRIILQGLQGVNLSQDQLITIQQQVKTQLLKQQAIARQQGKVPPTKVTLELMLTRVSESSPLPLTSPQPGGSSMPNTPQQQARVENSFQPSTVVDQSLEKPKPKVQTVNNLPDHIIKQGKYVIRDGKKILVLPPHVMKEYKDSLKQQQQQQESLLLPLPLASAAFSPNESKQQPLMSPETDKFELTDDYIQQTIKEALESGNLAPDLEEKLMNQLDDEHLKAKDGARRAFGGRGKRRQVYDPVSGDRLDDEWEPHAWVKNKISNQMREDRLKESTVEAPPPPQLTKNKVRVRGGNFAIGPSEELRKRIGSNPTNNRLSSMLFKHKEQLKKEIAKKRSQLEKELSIEIMKEVESLKKQAALKLGAENASLMARKMGGDNAAAIVRKRKSETSAATVPVSRNLGVENSGGKKRRKSEKTESGEKKWKKDRLYCICKTTYDETKFYVGCDVCSNWFHGACVGITPKMSKKLSEYVCDECTHAKQGSEVYCLCAEPYDEARFYIGCEKCPDWFHGRCVGILQSEAGSIEDYECPRCNPDSRINSANLKKLKLPDLEAVRKLFKQIQACKHSLPFRHPVDRKSNKKYYDVVKEPMDLETIEKKLGSGEYKTLADFLGDLTRIVENCRYYNPPGTPISKTAENLETFINSKLGALREKLLSKK